MPSRLATIGNAVRNHPVIVASWAATAGVLLGGFVTVQMLAPNRPVEKIGPGVVTDNKPAPKVEAKTEVKTDPTPVAAAAAATTGQAVATTGQDAGSSHCEQQTWPYLSRDCLDAMRDKSRAPRVVTTDRIDPPAMPAVVSEPPSAPQAPAAAPPAPAAAPVKAASAPAPQPASAPAPAVPEPAPAQVTTGETTMPATVAAEKAEKKEAKHERKKSKRKAKAEPKVADPADDDGEERAIATGNTEDDEQAVGHRTERVSVGRADRRRTVERRIVPRESDDDNGPSTDGRGGRDRSERVIVIRRGGGGFFENLFGGLGGRGFDD